MSRRKQSKPQQLVHTQDFSLNTEDASDSPAAGRSAHVCRRCCAEFSSLSELEQHETDCSPNPPVLILNDEPNESSEDRSYSRAGFMESFRLHRSTESPGSTCSDHSTVLCTSVFPQSSPDKDGFSWMKQNVVIESLESTKVAVAQLSDGRTSVSSLLQQLLVLQIQQIHQLQLIDQIRHQLLLIASRQAETPETLLICTKDLLPSSRPTNRLKALGAHLSRQLAAAAGIAKCLSSQSANIGDFRCLNQSNKESSHQHQRFLSQTKMSSLMFNNSFITSENLLLPPSSSGSSDSIPNLSEIVEDLDALAALARQRKCTKLSAPTPSLFKYTCRFCAKVFGSDSALQIHLRSHTRERPYRCNICGNRFSTRGNLKVHLQRHKDKNPHIRLDETQTAAGIPFGLPPERAAARWFDASPSSTTNLSSLIKKDNFTSVPIHLPQTYFNSAAWNTNPLKTSNIVETRQQRTMNIKSEDVKPSFNFVSKMTTWNGEESVGVTANPLSLPSSTSFSGFLSLKRSDKPKLQLPPVRASDPNECIVCHRVLSCQSALRMHYRTHTGERPYQCKLCGRAFTTKGNLKTHQAVHRAMVPLRVQHSCPICHKKFMNAVVLQQHVHVHMEGHLPAADLTNQKVDFNEGFRDKRKNFSGFCDDRFKSLSIHVSPSLNLTDANKKTSYPGWPELQLKWIKTERPEGSNEECSQTNNQQAAERGQRTSTFPTSDSSALSGQASVHLQNTRLDETLHSWLDSSTFTLRASATAPADLKLFNHGEDPPGGLREKGLLKNTYCDICGKSFACQSALDIHYRSHTKERPFICTTCSRGFSTKGNLKQHMLTHQMRDFPPHLFEPSNPNQAPNQQDGCVLSVGSQAVKTEMFLSSSFRNGLNLSARPLSSSACPRRTSKQHHCRTCGKSFSSSSALQIHERTHTGERPFACAVCGRAFTTKGNLKVHMGTHMWNSAPSRRGCRLSVDRSSLGFGTRPVKLPEPSQKSPETETAWNQQQQQV